MTSRRSRKPGFRSSASAIDEPAVLKRFSDKAKITFPLLSDPGSKTIEDYHIRNQAAKGKAEGVPYPGTFILDQQGIIRAGSSWRASGIGTRRQLLSRRQGLSISKSMCEGKRTAVNKKVPDATGSSKSLAG